MQMIIDYDKLPKESKDYLDYYLLKSMSKKERLSYKKKRSKELEKIKNDIKKLPSLKFYD